MSSSPPCLSNEGQLFNFPPTGPILLLREGIPTSRRQYIAQCSPVCIGPKIPQNTVVFFGPKQAPLPPHPPVPPPPRPPTPPVSIGNTEQTCTNTCPYGTIGDPISVTVEANTYFRTTLEAANASAMAEACAQADALRALSPCVGPEPGEPGSLWAMGWNFYENLGTGNAADMTTPTVVGEEVASLTWSKVDGNETFSVGRKSDGSLHAWGGNYRGELGQGTQSIFPSKAYNSSFPIRVGVDDDWAEEFACGNEWVIARKTDGTVHTWGYNWVGQLGLGDLVDRLSPTQVPGITNCTKVAAGEYTAFIIKADGTLWATGRGNVGQLGNGGADAASSFEQVGTDTDWADVQTAGNTVIALKTDGSVYGWGGWDVAIVPALAAATLIDAGPYETLSCGQGFAIARKDNGTLWAIGNNDYGQLGIGSIISTTAFVQVGSATNWSKASCGDFHAVALNDDGEMFGWGGDFYGALGQGSIANDRQSPVQIGPDDKWIDVYAGGGLEGFSFGRRSVTTAPPPPTGTSGVAFGGVLTIEGGYHIHRFDYDQDFIVVDGAAVSFEALRVGGGGGGGGSGGGSGAQVTRQNGITLVNGTYPVVIGARGRGQGGGLRGTDGGSTTFNGATVVGGVGGGATNDDGTEDGQNGYNGSGAGALTPLAAGTGGTGSSGNNGGDGAQAAPGSVAAGGGGAGNGGDGSNGVVVPSTSATGGAGGAGTADNITGTGVSYAGGGGGGATGGTNTGGNGGSSVGGKGANNATRGGSGLTAGSGGGGGAGFGQDGGDGARGVVIIRYLSPP